MENNPTENNNQEEINKIENLSPKNKQTIFSAIIIAGAMIALAILLKGNTTPISQKNTNDNQENTTAEIREISSEEHILGNPNAKIIIVEYSDTGCPFCKMFHNTMHRIVDEYKGDVAWVYRHFPIPSLHPNAFIEAIATECATEQGGNDTFWNFTDEIYNRTNSDNQFTRNDLNQIAIDLNLDMVSFNNCMESGKYNKKIEQDILDGQLGGVRGTPSSFIVIDGKVVDQIEGAAPYEGIKTKLDSYLR